MTNVYNKTIFYPNNTLIHNWFEEECLRQKTGEGRSAQAEIIGTNFGKTTFNSEEPHTSIQARDDTQKRVIGEKERDDSYRTTNTTYGDHSKREKKYLHPKLNTPRQKLLFEKYYKTMTDFKNEMEKDSKEIRLFHTTQTCLHPQQPFFNKVGLRHLKTQDNIPVPRETAITLIPIEKLKKMGSKGETNKNDQISSSTNSSTKGGDSSDTTNFWLKNINSGNIYRSFLKNPNPWARSSAFTQPLARTRGAIQYYQNAYNDDVKIDLGEDEEKDKKDEEKEQIIEEPTQKFEGVTPDYRTILLNKCEPGTIFKDFKIPQSLIDKEISQELKDKILKCCAKRGWIGLRVIKQYLRILSQNKSEFIDKTDFKYHLAKQAIVLTDEEIEKIYKIFDVFKANVVNFIYVLNGCRKVSEHRKVLIDKFKNQVKNPEKDFISFTALKNMADMNYHPEAIRFFKTAPDIFNEYLIYWDNMKEDDRVTDYQFREFFYDISSCVESDADFIQILNSLGMKD